MNMDMTNANTLFAQTAAVGAPLKTWHAACSPERHASGECWEVQARSQYEAGVKLRAQLRQQGKAMPADLDWTEA